MFGLTDYSVHIDGCAFAADVCASELRRMLASAARCRPPVDGAVYGTLLNDRAALAAMGDELTQPPYNAPPKAPVLYLKPRNTLAGHGAVVMVPEAGVTIGASVGIVIGQVASRVTIAGALEHVAGYVAVADLCVPHPSAYRPVVPLRARDGFCVIGPAAVARNHVADADALPIRIRIGRRQVFEANTSSCVRGVARLLSDVTEFMTLSPGDVLTLGAPYGVPVAHAGDAVEIRVADWEPLRFTLALDSSNEGEA